MTAQDNPEESSLEPTAPITEAASGSTQSLEFEQLPIPEALYSCSICREDCSWPAEDLFWSPKAKAWICRECHDESEHGEHTISLAARLPASTPVAPERDMELRALVTKFEDGYAAIRIIQRGLERIECEKLVATLNAPRDLGEPGAARTNTVLAPQMQKDFGEQGDAR